jgi:hypothetical protein
LEYRWSQRVVYQSHLSSQPCLAISRRPTRAHYQDQAAALFFIRSLFESFDQITVDKKEVDDDRFDDLSVRQDSMHRDDSSSRVTIARGFFVPNGPDSPTNQHAREMALITRRERAALVSVILRKHERLLRSLKDQKFAFQNQHTGCWDVFYLQHGVDSQYFREEAQKMATQKLWIERSLNDFEYSVF